MELRYRINQLLFCLVFVFTIALNSCDKPQKDEFGDLILDKGGVLMWYNQPSGIHYKGISDKTYLTWIDNKRNIKICEYDELAKKFLNLKLIKKWSFPDDHGLPVLHILKHGKNKGHILLLLNLHNSPLSITKSVKPESIDEFTTEKIIDSGEVSYPSIVESSNGSLLLFYKKNVLNTNTKRTRNLFFRLSKDFGESWTEEKELINFGENTWVYSLPIKVLSDSIHIAYSIKEAKSDKVVNIYYMYSPDFGKSWFYTGGKKHDKSTDKSDPIFATEDKYQTRAWDLNTTSGFTPRISFVNFNEFEGTNYVTILDTSYARWKTINVGKAKNDYYPSGISFDTRNPNYVICSESILNSKLRLIEKCFNKEDSTFITSRIISKNTNLNQIRPQIIQDYKSIRTMWVESIKYKNFQDFNSNLKLELINR